MIRQMKISNFKSINNQEIELKPLTIFTGTNSSGKTTLMQSILLLSYYSNQNSELEKALIKVKKFQEVRNFNNNSNEVTLQIKIDNKEYILKCDINSNWIINEKSHLVFEDNLYYISSNRIGQEDIVTYSENIKFGINGKNVFGFFQKYKDQIVSFVADHNNDETLSGNLKYWIKKILDLDIELYTEDIDGSNIKAGYKSSLITSNILSTFNVGTGVSYVIRILIVALWLKPNDIFMIENPEIHLHPKAISNLASFFAEIVSKNKVQLIIETHSEYFLHKLRYEIYKRKFNADDVRFFYKDDPNKEFEIIDINKNGHLVNFKKEKINFPTGFLDVSLSELLEIM
ncbi:AAA family ATPase [Campylobacter showae]|uniref:AAA family ATPase n=1 Tax=Campylobacter showae TaxID=204 RepID=UPI0028D238E2|nr:AAA family ATPase [Campylobacter showae]